MGKAARAQLSRWERRGLAVGSVTIKRMGRQPDVLALTTFQLILGSLRLLGLSVLFEREAGSVCSAFRPAGCAEPTVVGGARVTLGPDTPQLRRTIFGALPVIA